MPYNHNQDFAWQAVHLSFSRVILVRNMTVLYIVTKYTIFLDSSLHIKYSVRTAIKVVMCLLH